MMAHWFVAVTLALLPSVAVGGACTPPESCPKLSDGLYCPVNDVTEHGDINRDVKLISQLLKDDNYAEALAVYTSGNFSSKGAGNMRTLQDLAQKDMLTSNGYTNAWYTGSLDLAGGVIDDIWHNYIMACLENTGFCKDADSSFRKYVINKSLIGVVTGYVTYEMGAAVWKAAQGQTEDTKAAYAWDEAAAFYVGNVEPVIGDGYTGSVPGNLYSPYEFNWKRDFDFPDGTSTHTEAIPILNYGLLNIRGGDYNATNLAAAQMAIYKIIAINAIRSAIKYSNRAYNGGDFQPKYLAEGWAYWKTGSGYIATVNKAVVQQVDALLALNLTNTTFASDADCQIKQLVESIYADLGITCAMVGMWKDATANSCLAAACDDTGNSGTLISGSQAWVDMCKPVEMAGSPSTCGLGALAGAFALASARWIS